MEFLEGVVFDRQPDGPLELTIFKNIIARQQSIYKGKNRIAAELEQEVFLDLLAGETVGQLFVRPGADVRGYERADAGAANYAREQVRLNQGFN